MVYEHYDDSGEASGDAIFVYIYVKIVHRFSDISERFPRYIVDIGNREERTVKSHRLYKLVRSSDTPTTDIELFSDGHSLRECGRHDDIKRGVEETLVDAMKLGEEEFKIILRRLLKRWHPDKNQNSRFCAEIFMHIKEFAKKLMSKDIDALKVDSYRYPNTWHDHVERATVVRKSIKVFTFDVDGFASGLEQHWRRNGTFSRFGHGGCRDYQAYSTSIYKKYVPNPQPRMARVWIQQAKYDIRTACKALEGAESTSYNWICVLSQQVSFINL